MSELGGIDRLNEKMVEMVTPPPSPPEVVKDLQEVGGKKKVAHPKAMSEKRKLRESLNPMMDKSFRYDISGHRSKHEVKMFVEFMQGIYGRKWVGTGVGSRAERMRRREARVSEKLAAIGFDELVGIYREIAGDRGVSAELRLCAAERLVVAKLLIS